MSASAGASANIVVSTNNPTGTIPLPTTLTTWPATFSAPTPCATEFVSLRGGNIWQIPEAEPSCFPPGAGFWPGAQFASGYLFSTSGECPQGYTSADGSDSVSTDEKQPEVSYSVWDCCPGGWNYTTYSYTLHQCASHFLARLTIPVFDHVGPNAALAPLTGAAALTASDRTAYHGPVHAVYYLTQTTGSQLATANTPIRTIYINSPTSRQGLSTKAKVGIGVSASIAIILAIVCAALLLYVHNSRKRRRFGLNNHDEKSELDGVYTGTAGNRASGNVSSEPYNYDQNHEELAGTHSHGNAVELAGRWPYTELDACSPGSELEAPPVLPPPPGGAVMYEAR